MYYIIEKVQHRPHSYLLDTTKFFGFHFLQNAKDFAEDLKNEDGKQYDIVRVETVYTTQTFDEAHLEALDVPHMARD
jgi:hypothetical protein